MRYYTTHEVSRLCSVYPTTVINWINEGLLPAFTTPGGHRRVRKEDVVGLMRKNNMPIPEELLKGSEKKVLVIDDDPRIAKMVKTILEAEGGMDVAAAKSAFEAGFVVSDWKPDIILLDFLMPDVDGFQVCKRLREDEKSRDIPIVAVTVLRNKKEIDRMYRCGVTDYLAKPFKSRDILAMVRKYI